MKTIVQKLLCVALLMLPYYGFSQSGYQATNPDVNGIFIGSTYTKTQVEAKWGKPTEYASNMSEFGLDEQYDYLVNQMDNQFHFSENGVFDTFNVKTPNFVVYTALSGGIKVGDNISRIKAIGLGTPELQKDGSYRVPAGDDLFAFVQKNGVITEIYFVSLD